MSGPVNLTEEQRDELWAEMSHFFSDRYRETVLEDVAPMVARMVAEAWNEGYSAAWADAENGTHSDNYARNPYGSETP